MVYRTRSAHRRMKAEEWGELHRRFLEATQATLPPPCHSLFPCHPFVTVILYTILAVVRAAALLTPYPSGSAAEPALDRYDLGQRLILLERAWADRPDAAARQRALPVLKLAVPQLLAGKNADAAATLDRARLLLRGPAEPTA